MLDIAEDDIGKLEFELEYSAGSLLGNLSLENWAKYVEETLVNDKQEWDDFYRRYSRKGPSTTKTACR